MAKPVDLTTLNARVTAVEEAIQLFASRLYVDVAVKDLRSDLIAYVDGKCVPPEDRQTVTLPDNVPFIHQLVLVGQKLFACTITAPCRIIRFNNLNDLTQFDIMEFVSDNFHDEGWDMVYSPVTNRLYVTFDNEGFADHLHISEVEPETLTWHDVISNAPATQFAHSFVPSLCIAGDNLWIGAREIGEKNNAAVVGYRMSDWTPVGAQVITGKGFGGALRTDGVHLFYCGGVEIDASLAWVAKIPLADTMQYQVLDLDSKLLTDDFAIVGDHLYLGMEDDSGDIYQVAKSDLSFQKIATPVKAHCFGVFYAMQHLWATMKTSPGKLVWLDPNTLIGQVVTLRDGENNPNELVTDGRRLFVSCHGAPSKIIRMVA